MCIKSKNENHIMCINWSWCTWCDLHMMRFELLYLYISSPKSLRMCPEHLHVIAYKRACVSVCVGACMPWGLCWCICVFGVCVNACLRTNPKAPRSILGCVLSLSWPHAKAVTTCVHISMSGNTCIRWKPHRCLCVMCVRVMIIY